MTRRQSIEAICWSVTLATLVAAILFAWRGEGHGPRGYHAGAGVHVSPGGAMR